MTWSTFLEARTVLLSIDPKSVERSEELGRHGAFRRASNTLSSLQRILNEINPEIGNLLPDNAITPISQHLSEFSQRIQQLSKYRLTSQNPAQEGLRYEEAIVDIYNTVFPLLSPLVALSSGAATSRALISADIAALREELKLQLETERVAALTELARVRDAATASEAERADKAASLIREIEEQRSAVSAIVEEAREGASWFSTSSQAAHFATYADKHAAQSRLWLAVSIVWLAILLALSFLSLWLSIDGYFKGMDKSTLIQVGLSKVVILSILAYATSLSARNYFAGRHNEVVNRHRANAISSYRSLVEAVSSPDQRDIVLAQAASAVFAPQDTAFVKQTTHASEISPSIISAIAKSPAS